jgi:transcriptional regulator GlxA family with amidase domain
VFSGKPVFIFQKFVLDKTDVKRIHRMRNVGIFVFDDTELLDFAGPFEVFSVTSELHNFTMFNTFTFSEKGGAIRSINGMKILSNYSIHTCPAIDILVIPGGAGTKEILDQPELLQLIHACFLKSEITFSVCSGARILGKIGLLDNCEFTTHHDVIGDILKIAPKAIANAEKRFIDNGKIMTSGGISAGINLSLHIVEKIYGKSVREETARYMEYGNWR